MSVSGSVVKCLNGFLCVWFEWMGLGVLWCITALAVLGKCREDLCHHRGAVRLESLLHRPHPAVVVQVLAQHFHVGLVGAVGVYARHAAVERGMRLLRVRREQVLWNALVPDTRTVPSHQQETTAKQQRNNSAFGSKCYKWWW